MRALHLLLVAAVASGLAGRLPAADPKPEAKPGVVLDLCGPPDLRKGIAMGKVPTFTITYTVTVGGLAAPFRHPVCSAGYDPSDTAFAIHNWALDGYVVEKAGETRIRFIGWKDPMTGKVYPVTGIKIESKDLPADQLPTVVPPPKPKG
jgi:hypothetical protein